MKHLLSAFILVLTAQGFSQEFILKPLQSEMLQADRFIGKDNFNNSYSITDRTLHKTGRDVNYQFTALSLGDITTVDIINPLKITLFYQNANVAVILDNTLSEITRIDFNTITEFRNVSHATTATDRRLWIFNTDLQQLELFDYNLLKVVIPFQTLSQIASIQISNFNLCYIVAENILYSYNIYGALINKSVIPDFINLQQYNDNLIGLSSEGLFYKPAQGSQFHQVLSTKNDIEDFYLLDEILYIYNKQQLTAGQLKPIKK